MATPDQIPTDLTIDLGDDLSPEEFLAAARNFIGYVSEITDAQKGDGVDVGWTVRVREGSSLIGVEPRLSAPISRVENIYKQAKYGLEALKRGDVAGAGLSEKAIGHLKNLSDLAAKYQNGKGVNLWVKKKPIVIEAGIANTVREDWESDYYDFGTIEGRLEAIFDASESIKIRIKDYLYPKAINCVVPEGLMQIVLDSFRKRVEIDGRIHYRKDGTPISIEADVIDVLPDDQELPSADDVRGIMASA
ncbi:MULTISPECIES: hypothetical protein [unclassified Iodidimonas]|jgi:hypothetical protein|uniref:hypothetical protein n=1 Tax=unclassified Iodidimonas TaxID=2626145 RepID=UPI0024829531|nr:MULTISPECIES: hypothetical protein [unclassified Iodidimonas]